MKQLATATMLLALGGTHAAQAWAADVTVKDPWIRATVPAATSSGAFMQLQSAQGARLIEVRSNVAAAVEIHQMTMDGQTMRMFAVSGLDLPAGKPVDLSSGGYHVMLMELKHQLKAGDIVPLTLVLQKKGKQVETVTVNVPVKPLTYNPSQH